MAFARIDRHAPLAALVIVIAGFVPAISIFAAGRFFNHASCRVIASHRIKSGGRIREAIQHANAAAPAAKNCKPQNP
jgi:hypothetical protein